ASRHVGGANRTIIKLAQQLLIHPDVHLKDERIGALARIDQIYDLVSGNIASEVRGRIDEIKAKVPHALAQPVAKAICLLQFVGTLWTPQPSHLLESVRAFKAGLHLNDRRVLDGDVVTHLTLADESRALSTVVDEARQRSRTEPNALFWVAALDSAIDRETI